jgi:hypothetical protein
MDSELANNFNDRLSQWVSNQGFWFQLRYSMTGSGAGGLAAFHLVRIATRVLIFLLVVTALSWVLLAKRTESRRFIAGLKASLQSGLSASETEMRGFSRVQGQLGIMRLACQGGPETFYTTMEARNIRCKMNFFDGLIGIWDPGTVSVSRLDMELRAGTDDAESAHKIPDALFKNPKKLRLNTMTVADATLRWGFSERTRGSIEHSVLKIQRLENGMRLNLKGGTFSQNWLHKLEIVDLTVVCDRDGLTFEKAEFAQGDGTVDLTGLKVVGGERPQVEGPVKIRRLNLGGALPSAVQNYIDGSISGDFQVSGSTNTAEGLAFAGQVVLEGQDTVTLRDRLHVLKALSVIDYERNYNRIDFRSGSFQVKTVADGLELSQLSLKSNDLFTLEGKMRVRLPTPEEAKAAVAAGESVGGSPLYSAEAAQADGISATAADSDISLRRAAQETKRGKDGNVIDASSSLFDRLGLDFERRRLEEQAADRLSKTLRYEGTFQITLPKDIFDRSPQLAAQFPIDPVSGRIPLTIPIEGSLYDLTLKQAEDIYQQGKRQ